jgi:acyl carrier protein
MQDLTEKIRALIADRFGISAGLVSDELSFREDLGADSVEMMDFAIELETAFDISIVNEQVGLLLTVGDAIHWVLLKQKMGSVEGSRSAPSMGNASRARRTEDDDPPNEIPRLR